MINLPLRPSNERDFKLDKRAKDCIAYAVLTGCRNTIAFALFYPEHNDHSKADFFKLSDKGQRYCTQFFNNEEHKLYRASYETTLKAFIEGRGVVAEGESSGGITEERISNALNSLLDKAMLLVEHKEDLDPDTLKTITDVFKRLGVLKDEEVHEEKPRRYLPETCNSCRYKQFIDEQIAAGNIEDTEEPLSD